MTRRVRTPTAPLVLACLATVVAQLVIDTVVYKRTEGDPPLGFFGLPSWTLVAMMLAAGALAVAVLFLKPLWANVLISPLVVMNVPIALVAAGAAFISVRGLTVPGYLQHEPTAAMARAAEQALKAAARGGTCVIVRSDRCTSSPSRTSVAPTRARPAPATPAARLSRASPPSSTGAITPGKKRPGAGSCTVRAPSTLPCPTPARGTCADRGGRT